MKIFKKKFILLIATLLIANCGFKVLDKSQLQNLLMPPIIQNKKINSADKQRKISNGR